MLIRDCTQEDIPKIVDMSREFWSHTEYKEEEFQEDAVVCMLVKSIDDGLCLVLDINGPKGFVCGIKGPLLANFDVVAGTELAWWVDEGYRSSGGGLLLLKEIEVRAKNAGVKYWNMAYMTSSMPESIKIIYEKMGYNLNECLYQKVL